MFENGSCIDAIYYYYAVWQDLYTDMQRQGLVTEFIQGFPSNQEFLDKTKKHDRSIVILDDATAHLSPDLVQIVNVSARHSKASTFILMQSIFPRNPFARQISISIAYGHFFKNPRERQQFGIIARQINPNSYKWIVRAFQEATSKPYSCFLIDFLQTTEERHRFRSNLLPDQQPMIVWTQSSRTV